MNAQREPMRSALKMPSLMADSSVKASLLLLAALFLPAISGCCQKQILAPDRPLPDVMEVLRARRQAFHSMSVGDASFKFRVKGPDSDDSFTCTGSIYIDLAEDQLWVRAEKVIKDVFDLKVADGRFVLLLFETKEAAVGSRKVKARLPFLLWPDEIFEGFAGEPPPSGLDIQPVMDRWENSFILRYKRDGHSVRDVWVDASRLVVTGVADFNERDEAVTVVKFEDYSERDGTLWPGLIKVYKKDVGVSVFVWMGDVTLNPAVGKIKWGMIPSGYFVRDLDNEPVENMDFFNRK